MTPEDGATRGTKATSLNPEITSTTQGKTTHEEEQKVRTGHQKGKRKGKCNIPGSSNNHSNNAARAARLAGESRDEVTPENHPKSLN